MMAIWDLTEFKQQTSEGDRKKLARIDKALSKFDSAFKKMKKVPLKEIQSIIDACDRYLSEINIDSRIDDPHATKVLELQKLAVLGQILAYKESDSEVTRKQYDARARWKKLSEIFALGRHENLKPLEEAYWDEFMVKGNLFIREWLDDSDSLTSFQEAKGEAEKTLGISRGSEIIDYLEKLKKYEVKIKKGMLYDSKGKHLLDTSTATSSVRSEGSQIIYVMAPDGKLYVNPPEELLQASFHHSSFLHGNAIICAGTFKIKKGHLIEATTISGHYKPKTKHLLNFLDRIGKKGIDLSNVNVRLFGIDEKFNAQRFLDMKGYAMSKEARQYSQIKKKSETYIKTIFEVTEDIKEPMVTSLKEIVEDIKNDKSLTYLERINLTTGAIEQFQSKISGDETYSQLSYDLKKIRDHYCEDTDYKTLMAEFDEYQQTLSISEETMDPNAAFAIAQKLLENHDIENFRHYLLIAVKGGHKVAEHNMALYTVRKKFGFTHELCDEVYREMAEAKKESADTAKKGKEEVSEDASPKSRDK